jgi:quercetin dioxygenase-like cupin family protein
MNQPEAFLPTTETAVPIIHPPGSGRAVGVLDGRSIFKVLPEETQGAYAVLEQTVPAGQGPPLHVHRHETEIFYILEGKFELRVGDQTLTVLPGAIATCPRDIPHTFRNIGDAPGKLLLTIIPGRFGNYFIEVDTIPHDDHAAIKALTAKYDVEILE